VELGYGTTGFAVGDVVYGLTDWYRDGTAGRLRRGRGAQPVGQAARVSLGKSVLRVE